jgi:hypothetical protein
MGEGRSAAAQGESFAVPTIAHFDAALEVGQHRQIRAGSGRADRRNSHGGPPPIAGSFQSRVHKRMKSSAYAGYPTLHTPSNTNISR